MGLLKNILSNFCGFCGVFKHKLDEDIKFDHDLAREAIFKNGWLQGFCIPPSSYLLIEKRIGVPLQQTDVCIVISQSCNIVGHDFLREPFVEVLIARRLDGKPDGNCTHARNPRQLHFHIVVDGVVGLYEAFAIDKYQLPRQLLAEIFPASAAVEDFSIVIQWLIARYDRTAFPNNFVSRVEMGGKSSKRKKLFEGLVSVSQIYIALNSWDELVDGESYEAELVFLVPVEKYEDPVQRAEAEDGMLKIDVFLNSCSGIIANCEVRSEDNFTMHDARMMRLWGDYNYISNKDPRHASSVH